MAIPLVGLVYFRVSKPLVYVLIINWNGLEHLRECFDSLLLTTYPNARFILIDNASSDGSVAFVRETYAHDERVSIIECERNLGWSEGNNVGLRAALEAGADYAFLLNNDTATAADALDVLVDMAESHPHAAALAPRMVMFHEPSILNSAGLECSIIGSCWDRGLGRLDGPKWHETRQVIGVCGGAFFLRCSVLNTTGLLPDFGIYLDDLDLCLSMWNAGFEILTCPQAMVRHKYSATMGQGCQAQRKYFLNTRNRFRVVMRNFPRDRWIEVAKALAQGEAKALGRGALDGDWWKWKVHLASWVASARYWPEARRIRSERRPTSSRECRFWPLIRKEPLFHRGVEFPERGWYRPREVAGETLQPISRRAWLEAPGGALRVIHGNCYPHLGETRIRVQVNGTLITVLRACRNESVTLDVPKGRVEFESERIFDADETGETVDIGGWLRVDTMPGADGVRMGSTT